MVGCGGPAKATAGGASGATVTFQAPSSRPRAAEVLVDGDRFAVVKPRREAEAQFADERVPAWLTDRA